MQSKKSGSRRVVVEGVFSMVVNVNDNTSLDDLLKKETEWLGEPTSPNGVVMAMTLKDVKEVKK